MVINKSVDKEMIDNICSVFLCTEVDLSNFEPVSGGCANELFTFEYSGKKYIYRRPGLAIAAYLNRYSEEFAQNHARTLGIDRTVIALNPEKGWKLSEFVEGCTMMDWNKQDEVIRALSLIKTLHGSKIKSPWTYDFMKYSQGYIDYVLDKNDERFNSIGEFHKKILQLKEYADKDGIEPILCHNDTWHYNYLVTPDDMQLIDWEFAGNNDSCFDIASFCLDARFTASQIFDIYERYLGRAYTPAEKRHFAAYTAFAFYHWYTWAVWKEVQDEPIGESLGLWENTAIEFTEMALELYRK